MPQLELRTDISVDRETAWQFITDFERQSEWLALADEVSALSEDQPGEGLELNESGRGSMFSNSVLWRVTEFNPVRRLTLEGTDGRVNMFRSFELIETTHGTRLFIKARFDTEWWMEPVVWANWFSHFRRRLSQSIRESLEAAKAHLESVDEAA